MDSEVSMANIQGDTIWLILVGLTDENTQALDCPSKPPYYLEMSKVFEKRLNSLYAIDTMVTIGMIGPHLKEVEVMDFLAKKHDKVNARNEEGKPSYVVLGQISTLQMECLKTDKPFLVEAEIEIRGVQFHTKLFFVNTHRFLTELELEQYFISEVEKKQAEFRQTLELN